MYGFLLLFTFLKSSQAVVEIMMMALFCCQQLEGAWCARFGWL